VATDLLADLAAIPREGPEHLLDVALEIASRGERDRSLAALERYLETEPVERDVLFAQHAVGRALVRAAARGAPNPPANGWAFVPIDDTVTKPVTVREGELRGPPRTRRGSEGSATFECAILRTGHPVPLRLLSEDDRAFATATFYSLLRTRYEPAKKDGIAVPVIFTVRTSWRTS
jgi:hypothetical protein